MIVRVLGEGQWTLEPDHLEELNEIDEALEAAVERDDQEGVHAALVRLFEGVRRLGTPIPDDVIAESDLILPDTDSTVEEVRGLLDSTSDYFGLLPDAGEFGSGSGASEPAEA